MRYLLASVFIFLHGLAYSATHPADALDEINSAIENANVGNFESAVDLDALLDDALGTFLLEVKNPEMANSLPPLLSLMFSQAGAANGETLRGLLKGEVKSFVLNGVSSGAFAGRRQASANPRGMLAPLFADVSFGAKKITAKGQSTPTTDGWLTPFTLHDAGNGNDYDITGEFRRESDGRVRLARIQNLPALMRRLASESRE